MNTAKQLTQIGLAGISKYQTITLQNEVLEAVEPASGNDNLEFSVGEIVITEMNYRTVITDAHLENGIAKYRRYQTNNARNNELTKTNVKEIEITSKEKQFLTKLKKLSAKTNGIVKRREVKKAKGLTLKMLDILVKKYAIIEVFWQQYSVNDFYKLSIV